MTRRHWYELAAEVADAVWWISIVLAVVISLASWLNWRLIAFALLAVFPLRPLFMELLRWHAEKFIIVDYPSGKTMIVKVYGLIRQTHIKDWIGSEGRTETSTLFSRFIGFRRVQLTFQSRTYISGERVPIELLRQIDRAIVKKSGSPVEGERGLLIDHMASYVREGLVDRTFAEVFLKTVMGQNL